MQSWGWFASFRKRYSNKTQSIVISVIAAANAAHVVAVNVVLRNERAAAIAVVVVAVVAGGDRAADNRSTNEAGSNAPAPAERLGLCGGGGCDRAGNGEGGEGS